MLRTYVHKVDYEKKISTHDASQNMTFRAPFPNFIIFTNNRRCARFMDTSAFYL